MKRSLELVEENSKNINENFPKTFLRDDKNQVAIMVKPHSQDGYFFGTISTIIMDFGEKTFTCAKEIGDLDPVYKTFSF